MPILRKKSFYEEEDVARAKAEQLSNVFEADAFKDTTLNKQGIFPHQDASGQQAPMKAALKEVTKFAQQECNRIMSKKNINNSYSWKTHHHDHDGNIVTAGGMLEEGPTTSYGYIHGSGWLYPSNSYDSSTSGDDENNNVENCDPVGYKQLFIGPAGRSTVNQHYSKNVMMSPGVGRRADGPLKHHHSNNLDPRMPENDSLNRSPLGGGNFGVVYDMSRLC